MGNTEITLKKPTLTACSTSSGLRFETFLRRACTDPCAVATSTFTSPCASHSHTVMCDRCGRTVALGTTLPSIYATLTSGTLKSARLLALMTAPLSAPPASCRKCALTDKHVQRTLKELGDVRIDARVAVRDGLLHWLSWPGFCEVTGHTLERRMDEAAARRVSATWTSTNVAVIHQQRCFNG